MTKSTRLSAQTPLGCRSRVDGRAHWLPYCPDTHCAGICQHASAGVRCSGGRRRAHALASWRSFAHGCARVGRCMYFPRAGTDLICPSLCLHMLHHMLHQTRARCTLFPTALDEPFSLARHSTASRTRVRLCFMAYRSASTSSPPSDSKLQQMHAVFLFLLAPPRVLRGAEPGSQAVKPT